jgi:hypothetical protein
MRELRYALGVGLAGLALAAVAMLAPWYPGSELPRLTVIELVTPGDFAGQP